MTRTALVRSSFTPFRDENIWKPACTPIGMVRQQAVDKRESGVPGGGAGRRDVIGKSGVYRVSGPKPPGDAPIVGMASWGQGGLGAAGYESHGESELFFRPVKPEKCRDVMTKDPFCCLPSDTVAQAARLMKKHDIGILPVVERRANKKLLGVVTDRDLTLKVLARKSDPSEVTVNLVMSRPVIHCSPDDRYKRALQLMEQHRVKRMLVTDNSDRVVGVIAESDVALRVRNPRATGEIVAAIAQPDPERQETPQRRPNHRQPQVDPAPRNNNTASKLGQNSLPKSKRPGVVCIGLSAGGLKPLKEIFRHLSTKTGMAFVVIPHLSRTEPTVLPSLLSEWCGMPAELAYSGVGLGPNHIYVIPPGKEITVEDGYFAARPKSKTWGYPDVLTLFLKSLTKNRKPPGIAVILSGLDADGAAALREFKEAGGLSIVQSPKSANHEDMPVSAIGTHCVDFVLPPEEIAGRIETLGKASAA